MKHVYWMILFYFCFIAFFVIKAYKTPIVPFVHIKQSIYWLELLTKNRIEVKIDKVENGKVYLSAINGLGKFFVREGEANKYLVEKK